MAFISSSTPPPARSWPAAYRAGTASPSTTWSAASRRTAPPHPRRSRRSNSSAPTSTTCRDDEQLADELEAAMFEYSVELLIVVVGWLREASLAVVADPAPVAGRVAARTPRLRSVNHHWGGVLVTQPKRVRARSLSCTIAVCLLLVSLVGALTFGATMSRALSAASADSMAATPATVSLPGMSEAVLIGAGVDAAGTQFVFWDGFNSALWEKVVRRWQLDRAGTAQVRCARVGPLGGC